MAGTRPQPPLQDDAADEFILGRYRVLGEAGSGGFSTVHLAWDTRMQRRVAVKEMDLSAIAQRQGQAIEDIADLPDATVGGLEEARTAAMLGNANIVAVHDFEVRDNTAYIIMEYVDGMTLTELLRTVGDAITVDMVTAVFDGVAAALRYAHENQVLHLDIKPDNVMIDRQGQVKVMDFGLARLSDANGFQSAAGGTIGYMPPEQIMREQLDGRCDEWALASLAYEMISGKNPFLARDLSSALDRIEGAELVLPSLCLEGLPPGIDDVMFYALDPDRYKRYATVQDFAEEMDRFLGNAANGRKQLAACIRATLDEEPPAPIENVERRRPAPRGGSRTLGLIIRGIGAANVGILAFAGLTSISALGGVTSPTCWLVTAAAVALAALFPRAAGALGPAAIAAALIYGQAYALGGIVVAMGIAWWAGIGLKDRFGEAGGLGTGLFGMLGLGPFAPLLCGYLMPPGKAVGSAFFAAVLALALGCCGSQSLIGWSFPIGTVAGEVIQQNALSMAADPSTWFIAASWLIAAALCAACCQRRTLSWEIVGTILGAAALVAGAFGVGWTQSGFSTVFQPSPDVIVPTAIAAVLMLLLIVAAHRMIAGEGISRSFSGE